MSYVDLQTVLLDWDYDPDRVAVRKILGVNGTEKIQLRVELGLLQMEVAGRPDGKTPFGCESLLAYHKGELARHEELNGTPLGFALSPAHCEALCDEVSLYYRRSVALYVLEEFDHVVDDTIHNLGVMDLCRRYALEEEDRRRLEGFRPYALMMEARARAHQALSEDEPTSALAHVNRGLLHISSLFHGAEGETAFNTLEEVKVLKELRKELISEMPPDPLIVARKALREAIVQERYEEAARLHDQLQELRKEKVSG